MVRQRGRIRHLIAIGNNPVRARSHNRRVVLEAVRLQGPLGRAEIARLTHLTTQAVSNIVSALIDDGLLVQQGRRRLGRGQPPVQIAVNPNGGITAGVEIAAGQMVTVLVDLAGRLRAQRSRPLLDAAPERVAPLVSAEIAAARSSTQDLPQRLLGVGVVMPGPFGIEGLTSVGPTTLPGWADVNAAEYLSAATDLNIVVENDAAAAAVAERLHGAGRALRNFCFVYFGRGIGLGVVIDGRPYRGAFGNAGEVGHVVVVPGGRPCACGNCGCLERYASFQALQERFAGAGRMPPDLGDLDRLLDRDDPAIAAWLDDAARALSSMVATLENLYDPEAVIFGGRFPDTLIDALIEAMQPLPLSIAARRGRTVPRVIRGATGPFTAALGAAALPILETVTPRLDVVFSAGDEARLDGEGVPLDAIGP
jgi:predicted NBD/HSP70 family sugar kinase